MIKNGFLAIVMIFSAINSICASLNDNAADFQDKASTETAVSEKEHSFLLGQNKLPDFDEAHYIESIKELQSKLDAIKNEKSELENQNNSYRHKVQCLEEQIGGYIEQESSAAKNKIRELEEYLKIRMAEYDALNSNYKEVVEANKSLTMNRESEKQNLESEISRLTSLLDYHKRQNTIQAQLADVNNTSFEKNTVRFNAEINELKLRKNWFKPFVVSSTIAASLLVSYLYKYFASPIKSQKKKIVKD